MKRSIIVWAVSAVVVACTGAEPEPSRPQGGAGAAGAASGAGQGGVANTSGSSGSAAGGSAGSAVASAGFTFDAGVCVPTTPPDAGSASNAERVWETTDVFNEIFDVMSGPAGIFALSYNDGIYRVAGVNSVEPVVLAPNVYKGRLYGNEVYYFGDMTLEKVDVTAKPAVPVVLNTMVPKGDHDEHHIIFEDGDKLMSVAVGAEIASASVVLDMAATPTNDKDVFEGYVYFSETNEGAVRRVAVSGGEPETLLLDADTRPDQLKAVAGGVYFGDSASIKRAPVPAGEVKVLGRTPQYGGFSNKPRSFLIVKERLYWADEHGNVGWTALDGSSCGLTITKVPGTIYSIAVDDTHVYASFSSRLVRAPR